MMGRPKKIIENDDDLDLDLNSKDRQRVMDRIDILSEADLCLIYGCGRKAMQNRPRDELPPFFKAGGKRFFFREDVIKFFRTRIRD